MSAQVEARERFEDQLWRLNNLYWIQDKDGRRVPFRMNWAQEQLFEDLWFWNLVLKARQLGFSTFIDILELDTCLFVPDTQAGVIAHDRESAEELFRTKIKFPYDQLPDRLKEARDASNRSAKQLVFNNGSSIRVGTSLRSGTFQILHVSEFGKVCARSPEKAREIVTGSFETVGQGNLVFVESTAEGREGYFYDYCEAAQQRIEQGRSPARQEFAFHFFPWWKHEEYVADPRGIVITRHRQEYFERIEAEIGVKLSLEQQAWYIQKVSTLGDDMLREYPSTPAEAFWESIKGAYFKRELSRAREEGRITRVPYQAGIPVDTWWDLGMDDAMAIWFVQQVGRELHLIDYYESSGEGFEHYAKILREKQEDWQCLYGRNIAPHDIKVRELGPSATRLDSARQHGIKFEIAPFVQDKQDSIEAARNMFSVCWFDEENCDYGLKCLENYRKKWDEHRGAYKNHPLHNWASNGADAFQTGALGRAKAAGRNVAKRPVKRAKSRGWT